VKAQLSLIDMCSSLKAKSFVVNQEVDCWIQKFYQWNQSKKTLRNLQAKTTSIDPAITTGSSAATAPADGGKKDGAAAST